MKKILLITALSYAGHFGLATQAENENNYEKARRAIQMTVDEMCGEEGGIKSLLPPCHLVSSRI